VTGAGEAEILAAVRSCMRAALKLTGPEADAIDLQTTAAGIKGWTSMAHLELILSIERQFDMMFEADEIAGLASVAAIVSALTRNRS
jgi:acyl carrier protein